jgi:hypothetical protein
MQTFLERGNSILPFLQTYVRHAERPRMLQGAIFYVLQIYLLGFSENRIKERKAAFGVNEDMSREFEPWYCLVEPIGDDHVRTGADAHDVFFDELILKMLRMHDWEVGTIEHWWPLADAIRLLRPTPGEGAERMSAYKYLLRSRQYLDDIWQRRKARNLALAASSGKLEQELVDMIAVHILDHWGVPTRAESRRKRMWEPRTMSLQVQNKSKWGHAPFYGWSTFYRDWICFHRHGPNATGCYCTGFGEVRYLQSLSSKEADKCWVVGYSRVTKPNGFVMVGGRIGTPKDRILTWREEEQEKGSVTWALHFGTIDQFYELQSARLG